MTGYRTAADALLHSTVRLTRLGVSCLQVEELESNSRKEREALQQEWEQRFAGALAALRAEEQAKQYVQEIRIEQLTRRIVALEEASEKAQAAVARPPPQAAVTAAGGSVSDERVAVLISSVELLRGQIRCDHHKTPK